jgi:CheY-like chemotaxis protein
MHLLLAETCSLLSRPLQVTTATNGLEGLQLLQESLGGAAGAPLPPAFVLTDMNMPLCGGAEMTRRFREWYARGMAATHARAWS